MRRCSLGVRELPRRRTPTSLRVRSSCGGSSGCSLVVPGKARMGLRRDRQANRQRDNSLHKLGRNHFFALLWVNSKQQGQQITNEVNQQSVGSTKNQQGPPTITNGANNNQQGQPTTSGVNQQPPMESISNNQ